MVSRGYLTKRAMIITERKETAAMYILTTSDKISFEITNNLFTVMNKLQDYTSYWYRRRSFLKAVKAGWGVNFM